MGRLTSEDKHEPVFWVKDRGFDICYTPEDRGYEAISKLAHYEDLEEAGRLIEVIRCDNCCHQQYCKQAQYLGTDGYCSKAELKELEGDKE